MKKRNTKFLFQECACTEVYRNHRPKVKIIYNTIFS